MTTRTQEWMICHFVWGLDKYVIIHQLNGPRLILVNVIKHSDKPKEIWPVLQKDLEKIKTENFQ